MKFRLVAGRTFFVCNLGLLIGMVVQTSNAQQTIQVPADAPTVQAGINMANSGDTVNVAPGTYNEQINFNGKSITVQGSAAGVILKGSQNGPVVTFDSGETRTAVLQNVTVTNGSPVTVPSAGGIFIDGASPTIQNSTIEGNQQCGIGIITGAPAILNNEISNNTLGGTQIGCAPEVGVANGNGDGGGILLFGLSTNELDAQIIGNTIENNQAAFGSAGINVIAAGLPLIENNIIRDNSTTDRGAGIYVFGDTSPSIIQNLIYDNTINPGPLTASSGTDVGAGLNVDVPIGQFSAFPILIVNNTIVGNLLTPATGTNSQGSQLFAQDQIQRLQLFNNLIIGTTSQAAINCNPAPIVPPPVRPPPLARSGDPNTFSAASPEPRAGLSPGSPTFTNNDVYNLNNPGATAFAGACPDPTGTSGNISADPLFATGVSDAHPYELQFASPAIDSGDNQAVALPTLDILGQPRIQNAKGLSTALVDMGVYEYPGVPAPPPPTPTFTLTVTPTSATVQPGGSTSLTVAVTPTAAGLGPVQLACSSLPATVSCAFSPALLNFASTSRQTSVLTLTTAAPVLAASSHPLTSPIRLSITLAGCLFFPLLLVFKPASPKKNMPRGLYLGIALLILTTAGLSGCGKDKYIVLVKPQTYNFTVQATATNFNETQQVPVTLVVAGNYPGSN